MMLFLSSAGMAGILAGSAWGTHLRVKRGADALP
jgi:hypothetical protein